MNDGLKVCAVLHTKRNDAKQKRFTEFVVPAKNTQSAE